MDKKFELLKKIIPCLEDFFQDNKSGGQTEVLDFANWLSQQEHKRLGVRELGDPRTQIEGAENVASRIAYHVDRLHKYAKYYMKQALKDTPMVSNDDFGYLASLAFVDSMQKSELIQMNVGEIPSGMEVIKRLLKNKLIAEFEDPGDKRAKRVCITPMGKQTFFGILPKMSKVSELVKGNLTPEEMQTLYGLLQKLDQHHEFLYPRRQALSGILH
jgi:MarR family transcriptional regulator, lower aerobic nicotinate degradation pathway regulator